MTPMWAWEPTLGDRQLAAVPDEQLAADLREAIVAVGYWFDAWWAMVAKEASPMQVHRAHAIETMRAQVALIGAGASLDDLALAAQPLLGEYLETAELRSAVDLVRDVTMHRWPMIKYMRGMVERWEADRQDGPWS